MSVFERQTEDDVAVSLHHQLNAANERIDELVRADRALRKIIVALAEDKDLSSFVGTVLTTASEQLEAPVVEYWVHDSDHVARLVMSCREGRVSDGSDLPNDPRVAGITIPASMTGVDSLFDLRGHFVSDLANDPVQHAVFDPLGLDLRTWCRERGVTTHLNVQLRFGDKSLGSLVAYFRSAQVLTDGRIELAHALANQITLAIRLTELSGQAQASALERASAQAANERSEALASVNSVLTSSLSRLSGASDMREFLAHVFAEILRVTGASNVAATRYNAEFNQLQLELFHDGSAPRWGLSKNELELWASPYDADITPAFQIGLKHRHIFVASMMKDQAEIPIEEFALPGGLEWMAAIGASDAAVSVLFVGDQPVGTFHLHFTGGRTLRPNDLPLLNALSQQAAIALSLVNLSDQAQQAAIAREREMDAEIRAKEASRISNFFNTTLGQMSEGADLQLTIESIVAGLAREIGAAHVFLFRHDAATGSIRLNLSCIEGRIRHGLSGEELPLWAAPFPDDITPGWRIMMEARGLFTPEMTPIPAHEFAWPGTFEYANRAGLSDMGHIVLFAGNDPVGSIGFCLNDGRKLKASDKAFIEGVAKQAALAIRMLDFAEQAKQAAVAREQERATTAERARLAREIHDTLAQSFSGIIVQLRAMQRASAGAEGADVRQMHADNALELASSGLAEARRSLSALRSTELEGRSLREALTLMGQSTAKRCGIPVEVEAAGDLDFGAEVEPELLRIAQESVTNAVKHSGASQIVIALRREGSRYDLCIEDNGRGFDLEQSTEGFGLIGMQERADRIGATMSIKSSDAGTAVCVRLDRGAHNAS